MTDWNEEAREYIPEFRRSPHEPIQWPAQLDVRDAFHDTYEAMFEADELRTKISTILSLAGLAAMVAAYIMMSWVVCILAVILFIVSMFVYPTEWGERTNFDE